MNARQQSILQMVIDKGRMSVADLAKMTGVSEVTIRQDLNSLEKQSYLRRTHGFAVPLDSEDVETRMMTNFAIKRELAARAATLVSSGKRCLSKTGAATPCSPVRLPSAAISLSSPSAAILRIC
jgi:DeoR/GlpR family transcriptional regulator of sugar metabolism